MAEPVCSGGFQEVPEEIQVGEVEGQKREDGDQDVADYVFGFHFWRVDLKQGNDSLY